jgi:hypothetical protein
MFQGEPQVPVEPVQADQHEQDDKDGSRDVPADGALEATGMVAKGMPENKSKNQVAATTEEVTDGSHRGADLKELRSYVANKVLGPRVLNVTRDISSKTFDAGWRRTWKGDGDTRVPKSRLYARGYQDKRDRGWIETYLGTPDEGHMRTAIIFSLLRKFKAAKADVKTAFLQTEADDELYLRMPSDLPPEALELGYVPGGVYRQLKAVYGRIDSPRLFTQAFKKAAQLERWAESQESILLFSEAGRVDGVMFMHMDDLLCFSEDPVRKLEAIGKHFEFGSIDEIKSEQVCVYTGLDIVWSPEVNKCEIGQARYLGSIKTDLTAKQKKRVFGVHDLKKAEPGEVGSYNHVYNAFCLP